MAVLTSEIATGEEFAAEVAELTERELSTLDLTELNAADMSAATALLNSLAPSSTVSYGPNASCVVQIDPTLSPPPSVVAFGTEAIAVDGETDSGQTYVVTTALDVVDPDDGVTSLREAASLATSLDTITFAPSLKGETILLSGSEIKISTGITIDANKNSRVFYIDGGTADDPATLIGLAITNGYADGHAGGAIYVAENGTLNVENSTFTENTTRSGYNGGAICVYKGTLNVENSTFTGNAAGGDGGAIYVAENGTLSVENSTFTENSAYGGNQIDGGAIGVYKGTLLVENSTFTGNAAGDYGGAIYMYGNVGSSRIASSVFDGNTAGPRGGAIYAYGGKSAVFDDLEVKNNTASNGGGVYLSGNHTLTNSTFTGNVAGFNGGAIWCDGTSTLSNITATGNVAESGGAIYVAIHIGGSSTLSNITATGNVAESGGAIYNSGTTTLSNFRIEQNQSKSVRASDAAAYGGGIYNSNSGTLTLTSGAIVGNVAEAVYTGTSTYYLTYAYGGGIYNRGKLTATNVTIAGNEARYSNAEGAKKVVAYGGGLYNNLSSYSHGLTLRNVLVVENKAETGGGIYGLAAPTVANATIARNVASKYGGVYVASENKFGLYNSIIAENVSEIGDGSDVYVAKKAQTAFCVSLIGDASSLTGEPVESHRYSFLGTATDPLSPGFVDSANGDYSLAAGSPAIDAGLAYWELAETDLVGNARLQGTRLDLGAYEFVQADFSAETETPSTVVTTVLDVVDPYDGLISLREAIEYAESGATISFDADVFAEKTTIELAGLQLYIDKDLTITAPEVGVVLDAKKLSRIATADANVRFENFEFRNGYAYSYGVRHGAGGAIYVAENGTLSVENSTFTGNATGDDGGAIYVAEKGTLNVENSTFTGNAAGGAGGAIYVAENGTLSVENSTFTGNAAGDDGGAISVYKGTLNVENSTFTGNAAGDYNGGAIYMYGNVGSSRIASSVFDGNTAGSYGGAIYAYGGKSAVFDDLEVKNNTASYGGGVYLSGNHTLTNSTFTGNVAGFEGGAIHCDTSTLSNITATGNVAKSGGAIYNSGTTTLSNFRIEQNQSKSVRASDASVYGGGIYNRGTLTLTSGAIVGNVAEAVYTGTSTYGSTYAYGGGIYNGGKLTATNVTIAGNEARYSNVEGAKKADAYGGGLYNTNSGTSTLRNVIIAENYAKTAGSDVYLKSGTLNASRTLSSYEFENADENYLYDPNAPLFAASFGDYRLAQFSQAIDKGDSQYAYEAGLTDDSLDLMGKPRFIGEAIDLGAYESEIVNNISQSGVFRGVVELSWKQTLDEACAMRLTWISGAKSSVFGVFGASGEFAWDTTSFDDGAGRLIVEYLDENDAVLRNATIAATIINDENVVVKRGTIDENETWEAGKVYLVVGRIDVASGATLNVVEGAVVKFWRGATICAQESAGVIVGDAATLTRAEDDAVGGDTNKDGENSVAKYGASYFKGQGIFQVSASATVKYVSTTISGTLQNSEVWFGGQVYRVTSDLVVPSGVTLTIQPGAILKFDAGKSLIVEKGGTLIADGISAAPIVFTSIYDDAVGGDTNADDGRYKPQPGDWKQIRIFGQASFKHAQVFYSGSDPNNSDDGAIFAKNGGQVLFNNGVIAHSKLVGAHCDQASNLRMTNSVIYDAMYATHNGDYLNCTFASLNYLCNTNYYYYSGSFVNCVVADVTKKFMSGGEPSYNFANCVFWNAANSGEQTFYAVGKNGNIWANPLFRDTANGDYRLSAGSPCIDAAEGTLAPETDADGASRVTDAYSEQFGTPDANGVYVDVGAYEFADVVASSLDLEPVDLKAPTNAVVGETVTLEWTTRNNGTVAATGAWSDEIYLVSASGREILVATILRLAAIGAGDLQTHYAQVVVPEIVDGEYSFAVRVNPNRDVFEGVNVDNNVLVAQNVVKIEQPTLILSDAFEVNSTKRYYKLAIPAGQAYSLRYAWPSGEQTTSVSILASEGMLPTDERCDWRAVQTTQNVESGLQNIAVLYVPASDEARVVYVSFVASFGATVGALTQNDDAFDVYGFADGQSFTDAEGRGYVAAVQLGETSNVAIVGVGFQDGMTATIESVSADGAFVVDATVRVVSATSATLSFNMNDASAFFGNVYRLKVTQNGQTTTIDDFIYAKPKSARPSIPLVASLDIPDSIREGRVYKGCVEYQNVSTEVIAFPVFTVSGTAPLAFSSDEIGDETEIRLLGLGASEAAWLAPGESARVEFYFKATFNTRLSLATWFSDETTTPFFESEFWNSWSEYRQDLSAAITRLDERGFRTNDYDYVADFLRAQTRGESTTGLAGRLQSSDSGEGLAECELVASWSVDEREYRDYATTDENGFYVFNFLPSNVPITLSAASGAYDLSESSITLDGQDVLRKRLTAKPFGLIAGRVVDENGRTVQNAEITLTNEAGETWNAISDRAGVYSFAALKSGTYLVSLNTTGKFKPSTPVETIVKNGIATTGLNLTAERGAEVSGKICDSEGLPLADAAILVVDASGNRFCALTDAEGRFAVGGFDEGEATITISAVNCVSVVETVALTAQKTTKINKSLQNASLISGFVRNNDGTPAADASFILTDENENGYWVSVDENGFYCVDFLPPGDYRLEIRVGETLHISRQLTIAEGSDGETIDFVLSATTRLTGTATYADGQPLAGVILTLSDENGRRYATVAEDGTYAFENLAAGVYELAISNVKQTWTVSWNGEESAPTQNVELDFIGRVSGVLTLANGEAAATAWVYLFKDGELVDSVFANGEGRLDVYLREPGFYTFRAVHANGFFRAWEANVERGSDLTFEATAGTASAQANATGLATDDETQTVYWNLLSVDDEGRATAELSGSSDGGAALNFVGLAPGKYRVAAYSGMKGAKSEFEILEGVTATTFDLAFSEKAVLTATVQLPTGFEADRADAIGWLYDAENNLVDSAALDDEGNLLYYFLEPGEYALVVVAGRTVGTAKLTIPENETAVSKNVELTEATVTISGSITLDGAPIGDQGVVLIKNGDGVVVGIGYSDVDGNFVAYALEAESYQIVCVDYATTATATVELTDEELTGVAIRLAVVQNVCVALTTAEPTETESATEQTTPIISSATAEEDPGNFWQKLNRQKMYYNDEILPELLRYKCLPTNCCASCGKKYDLYNRTLNDAWDDHDCAKKSLDVLEKLQEEIVSYGWDLGKSVVDVVLLFVPGGPVVTAVRTALDFGFLIKDLYDIFREPELDKLLTELNSIFAPYNSEFADGLLDVYDALCKLAERVGKGELDKAQEAYRSVVNRLTDMGRTTKKLKEDFEWAWECLDKLTDPSSPSKVTSNYVYWDATQTKRQYDQALANTRPQKAAAFVEAEKLRKEIVKLKKCLSKVVNVLGPLGDFMGLINNTTGLCKSIEDFHRFYEECNNNMFDFRDEVRKLSEAYPPQCTNPNCSCHDDNDDNDDDDKDLPKDEPRDDDDDKDLPKDEPRDDEDPDEPRSQDPNEILGPIGYDFQTIDVGTPDEPFLVIATPNWIDGKAAATQHFTIYFENKPTATAAAQEVFVEATLSEAFDWSTFELGVISIGNVIYDEPVGCVDGVWTVKQKSTGEQIQISVEYDPATGDVKWYLRSYVASTPDHFPSDAYAGFLPPNDKEKGTGEGYVSFSIKLNDGLTSNTRIETSASIVFDVNESIVTNTWVNTIDADAPTVEVVSTEYDETSRLIAVEWSGADVGSGIACYDVYYSTDGGATFELWLMQTVETSALFALPGIGSEYVFKVVAFDGVGNASSGVTASITIESDDVICWSESTYVVSEGCALRLSAEGSTGEELTYYWDLSGTVDVYESNFVKGDAEIWTSPQALGFDAGEYEIRLRVRDKSGIYSGIATATLRVETTAPIIDVRRTTTEVNDVNVLTKLDLAASFFSGRTAEQWTLNWGDGTKTVWDERSSAATFAHSYEASGEAKNYIATLNLTASDGEVYEFVLGETLVPAFERVQETPSLVVTTNSDVVDERDGKISLREAILYAEADATLGDTITFAPSFKAQTITLTLGQLVISQSVTVDATTQSPGVTVDANKQSRVLYLGGETTQNPVELIGLTIIGGSVWGEISEGDVANSDYTLAATNSQALDKGNNSYIAGNTTDLAGKPRLSGAYVDLGAYERLSAASAAVAESESALHFVVARIFDATQASVLQDASDGDAVSSASGVVASVRELSAFDINAYGDYSTTLPPACSLVKRAQTFVEAFDDVFELELLVRRDVEFNAFAAAVLESNERANAVDPFESAFACAFDDGEEEEDSLFDF